MLRLLTAGESHGQALVVVLEGLPAGLELTVEEIQEEMGRRRLGYGRGPRQRFEVDELTLIGGVRHGRTLGSPLAIEIKNTEWFRSDKWHEEMSPAPGATKDALTKVRPGHADLAGMQKYGFGDARDVLERASARETAARVAAGAVAKKLLSHIGVEVMSHVIQMGSARASLDAVPTMSDLATIDEGIKQAIDMLVGLAAALRRKAGRFVEHNCGLGLANHHGMGLGDFLRLQLAALLRLSSTGGLLAAWRHTQHLPLAQTIIGFGALAIDADLAGTCPAADRGKADLRQVAFEPAIQPYAIIVFAYGELAHRLVCVGGLLAHEKSLVRLSPTSNPLMPNATDRIT